jgi:uncharacterized membrane protein YkvA (DUF1232 family)
MFERIWLQVRLTWRLLFDTRVPITAKLIPLGAVLYVLSPLDLIPDVFAVVGQVDDIGLMLLSMRVFIQTVPVDIVEEHRAALTGKPKRATVIEGKATKSKRSTRKEQG